MAVFSALRSGVVVGALVDGLLVSYSINLSRLFFCLHPVACLAAISTSSFLGMLLWAGIQCSSVSMFLSRR